MAYYNLDWIFAGRLTLHQVYRIEYEIEANEVKHRTQDSDVFWLRGDERWISVRER